jgi:hypothetical protein
MFENRIQIQILMGSKSKKVKKTRNDHKKTKVCYGGLRIAIHEKKNFIVKLDGFWSSNT